MKSCTICHAPKPLDQFSKDKRFSSGRRPECKTCEHKRGSYSLKSIRYRLKHLPQWYGGITCDLTAGQIEALPNECHFCHQLITEGASIHRLDHGGNYTLTNVAKVHKHCHAKHGGHTQARNPRKGFGSRPEFIIWNLDK
jgi:hypothetical protein